MHITINQKKALHPFNLIIFILSVYVIGALLADAFFDLSAEMSRLLHEIDYAICVFFFIDFLVRFFSAKSKMEYMKWGWLDLISSIPVFDVFLAGRAIRIFQLLRVLRAFRSLRMLTQYYFHNKVRSAFTSASIIGIMMVIFSAIAILEIEKDAPGSNIKTAEDALWWAYVTITTVGYGDKFPVTSEGRIVAAALITVGVGLFGTFTAYVASWFAEKREEHEEAEKEREKEEKIKVLHQEKEKVH